MRKGITQEQVNAAADALVAKGEKPTVEKVRLALGTGSPNTVTRMLKDWQGSLAQRLEAVISLPEVPPTAAQAFAAVWRASLDEARGVALAEVEQDRHVLFAEQTSIVQERKLWDIALKEANASAAESTSKLAGAERQLDERQARIDQLSLQLSELQAERDRLLTQSDRQQRALEESSVELGRLRDHVQTVEDRSHQQVDHARQEQRSVTQQFERLQREHTKMVAQMQAQANDLRQAVRVAEQHAATQEGRVLALESALVRWPSTAQPRKAPAGKGRAAVKPKATSKGRRAVRRTKAKA